MFYDEPQIHTRNTGTLIRGFDHVWEVHVPLSKLEYVSSSLPPPFEAYGTMASFIRKECLVKHSSSCRDKTLELASKAAERTADIFSQYNLIFGITRNKRDALNTKKKRAAQEELELESESEESKSTDKSEEESQGGESEEEVEEVEEVEHVSEEEEEEEEEEEDEK